MIKQSIRMFVMAAMIISISQSAQADEIQDKIKREADYIIACQYMTGGSAYGAINNIYGEPTWVVPRENAMAILGLVVASEKLADASYAQRANLAMDYLISVQDIADGAWRNQYNYTTAADPAKSPTQTAEVMIAMHKLGYSSNRYNSMKMGAQYLMECQKVINKQGNDDGLICGGKDASGTYYTWRWTHDNSYAYQALKAAQEWAITKGDNAFSIECEQAAEAIISGINNYLYSAPVWLIAIDENGISQDNPDLLPGYQNLPSWINYAPQMLDLPVTGVNSQTVGEWIHTVFQQADGSCIAYTTDSGIHRVRKSPGFSFQASLCWYDLGQNAYADNAWNWAENTSGLWQLTEDDNHVIGGWIDWDEISPNPGPNPNWCERFIDTSFYTIAVLSGGYDFNIYVPTELQQQLCHTAAPYIKYFTDRALDNTPSTDNYMFEGLVRSFWGDLGGHSSADLALINYGAAAYDQSLLGRICLANGTTTILDTYVSHINVVNSPLIRNVPGLINGQGEDILNGPHRIVRILGRDEPWWWESWDWILDTGAAATLILYASDAYQQTLNNNYKNIAIMFADYILELQDTDGGVRYGPIGMYHEGDVGDVHVFYWNLKSTEQNERALYALRAIYQLTNDTKYSNAADNITSWLKSMYNFTHHLYHSAAVYEGGAWVNTELGTETEYVATDVIAFAPTDIMFSDPYFGATQAARDSEVDEMFAAIESRTAFFDNEGKLKLFAFSVSQQGPSEDDDFGSVEFSSQMALSYLRVAQLYSQRAQQQKTVEYLDKYNALVTSLGNFFTEPDPTGDPGTLVAPYASYLDHSVAGHADTGIGFDTYNCQAALASVYYAFAKSGYDPTKLGGGEGIPQAPVTLNMTGMPWYKNQTPYSSTGAACAQMILNYIRDGAGEPLLDQDEIYEYAKGIEPLTGELTPYEVDKALGHFDPYDYLISNWANSYDTRIDGNPYKGYNYTVDTYDPGIDPDAINKYMRDICHWMAYTVTEQDWWLDGTLVARSNTPAAIPIYGTYNHWVVVKGYATSANPCPDPHTDPYNTPDFTVYGFWIKDPLEAGIGKDTYKIAAECQDTYFLPLATGDSYDGMYLQVAEPPAAISEANVGIPNPQKDLANLKYIGIDIKESELLQASVSSYSITGISVTRTFKQSIKAPNIKQSWRDIVDSHLLSDPTAVAAFEGTKKGTPVLVKRMDKDNSDYYLVPFGKRVKRKGFLAFGVIILDTADGHFREASWTQEPEKLLNIERVNALSLVRKYLIKEFLTALKNIPRRPNKTYARLKANLYIKYLNILRTFSKAKADLVWQVNGYSSSPYKPYWRIIAGGEAWYVTQDGKVNQF